MMKTKSRLRLLGSFLILVFALFAGPIPRRAPKFSMSLVDGSVVSLSQFHGKVVLVAYILTTCPHCQAATGIFKQLQTDLGPKGLQIIECAVEDDSQKHIADFQSRFKPNFPLGWSERASVAPVLQPDDKLHIMPQSVLIDRKGMIRAQFYGDDPVFENDAARNLTALISKYL
jgi:peroxiredoxin